MSLPIFIDIDGTLTTTPDKAWGPVIAYRIDKIQRLVEEGHEVVLWSAGGSGYAKSFARRVGLGDLVTCIGKPRCIVDDTPYIRPDWEGLKATPDMFFGGG